MKTAKELLAEQNNQQCGENKDAEIEKDPEIIAMDTELLKLQTEQARIKKDQDIAIEKQKLELLKNGIQSIEEVVKLRSQLEQDRASFDVLVGNKAKEIYEQQNAELVQERADLEEELDSWAIKDSEFETMKKKIQELEKELADKKAIILKQAESIKKLNVFVDEFKEMRRKRDNYLEIYQDNFVKVINALISVSKSCIATKNFNAVLLGRRIYNHTAKMNNECYDDFDGGLKIIREIDNIIKEYCEKINVTPSLMDSLNKLLGKKDEIDVEWIVNLLITARDNVFALLKIPDDRLNLTKEEQQKYYILSEIKGANVANASTLRTYDDAAVEKEIQLKREKEAEQKQVETSEQNNS